MAEDGEILLRYRPEPTAKLFHESDALFRGIRGPIGSGKTVACCWELFRMAVKQEPLNGVRRTRWGIVRQSYPELKSTTIKTWQDWFPPSICPITFDAPIRGRMKLPWHDGTVIDMELIFLALEREEDAKKLLSLELTGIYFNEARELPWRIIEAAMGRIGRFPSKRDGGHTRKAAIADTNPPDDAHWWFRQAEQDKPDGFEFFNQPPALIKTEGGYIGNPNAENLGNLKDGIRYYLDQVAGKDEEWIKVYLMGEYGTIQTGKPVYGSSYVDSLHCSKLAFEPVAKWPLILSFDFGLTPAAVFVQQTPMGQVRVIEEIVTEDCGIRQLCEDFVLPRLKTRYKGCNVVVTGDPAGKQRAQTDERTAYDIIKQVLGDYVSSIEPCETNVMTDRLDAVKKLLNRLSGGKPVFQLSPECSTLRRGFLGAYKFRKVKVAGGSERYMESPEKNMASHVHDALQYALLLVLAAYAGAFKAGPARRGYVSGDEHVGL